MKYIRGMKYQLVEDEACATVILGEHIRAEFFELFPDGRLVLYAGFAWDGASGPTIDSKSSMRASAFHDALCVLMRAGRLSYEVWQDRVNALFKQQCLEDGMWAARAAVWHAFVEFADAGNPEQGPDRKVLKAP